MTLEEFLLACKKVLNDNPEKANPKILIKMKHERYIGEKRKFDPMAIKCPMGKVVQTGSEFDVVSFGATDLVAYIAVMLAHGDLWNAGIRPNDIRDRSDVINSKNQHIEDLRKIMNVFLEVKK